MSKSDEPMSMMDLARQVLAWWDDAQYITTGEHGGRNVFDHEPDFVQTARAMMASATGEGRDREG